jgi:O-antigen/teichoic acid export membrane protein
MSGYSQKAGMTLVARVISIVFGFITSILLARILGSEAFGVYSLAMLLPTVIVIFADFGISPASVYYVAQGKFSRKEIFGNNILFTIVISFAAVLFGFIVSFFFSEQLFLGVPKSYLFLALLFIPIKLFFTFIRNTLLGAQLFLDYNLLNIVPSVLFFISIVAALWVLKSGPDGALMAGIIAWLLTDIILFLRTKKAFGGVSLKRNYTYQKQAISYGLKAYLGNALQFLNYRLDMFLVNSFLNVSAVGYYSIAVLLAERLWLVSQVASTVIFPRIASETDEKKRLEFTPLVARTVFWITAFGALALFLLSRILIVVFYSDKFLASLPPLQALLIGVIGLAVGRVLALDLSGRGRPILNTYVAVITLVSNISLNLIWIPAYGIVGAAWASTVSYLVMFFCTFLFYYRITGNSWQKILLPQPGDWAIYKETLISILNRFMKRSSQRGENQEK